MKQKLFLLLGVLFQTCLHAQSPQYGREPFVLKVKRNAKQEFIQQINQTAYFVTERALQLYPHEKVLIEIEIKADTIFAMTAVPTNQFPEKTIEIEFCQEVNKDGAKPAQYFIKNPLSVGLGFNLLYYDIEESSWATQATTAPAKWTKGETVQKTISSFVFKDWQLDNGKN